MQYITTKTVACKKKHIKHLNAIKTTMNKIHLRLSFVNECYVSGGYLREGIKSPLGSFFKFGESGVESHYRRGERNNRGLTFEFEIRHVSRLDLTTTLLHIIIILLLYFGLIIIIIHHNEKNIFNIVFTDNQ